MKNAAIDRPAGLVASLTLIVGFVLAQYTDVSSAVPGLAAAIALLLVGGISLIAPREAGFPRPVGLTAAAATVVVWIASLAGAEITTEVALAIVTAPSIIVSLFTPRNASA